MEIKAAFGARLKELRGEMRQEEFGKRIGVSRTSISYYENGSRTADIEIIDRLCREFDVSADWLLGRIHVKSPSIDIQQINEITGLSEKAIRVLEKAKWDIFFMLVINELIEMEGEDDLSGGILASIGRYLKTNPTGGNFIIENHGNIRTAKPNEPVSSSEVSRISAEKLILQVMFDEIEHKIKHQRSIHYSDKSKGMENGKHNKTNQ